jgi:hypothetical protein
MTDAWEDPFDQPVPHPLLGRRVDVRLTDPPHKREVITGVLVRVTAYGDVEIRLDSGQPIYAWPALEITEAAP